MNVNNALVINDELHINLSDRSNMNIESKTLVKLRPKPFLVLLYLYTHYGRCISKDELFAECWNGAIVSDQSLTNTISTLRKALNIVGTVNIKLTTVSRAGYLLEDSQTGLQFDELSTLEKVRDDWMDRKIKELQLHKKKGRNEKDSTKIYEEFSPIKKLLILILSFISLLLMIGCKNTDLNLDQGSVSMEDSAPIYNNYSEILDHNYIDIRTTKS
ncbi:transcriptional regulator [Vibrio sp.]|uniref:transcriptional regulator n=1 Tax=Vibrio sp. TaxID=678 RepID=UPI0037B25088